MAKCNRGEALPDMGFQDGTLYLSPPMEPTLKSIERILERHAIGIEYPAANILAIPYTKQLTCRFCKDFLSYLNAMELVETDQVKDIKHLLNIIQFYRKRGFRIALDDLGAGYSSLNLLHHIKPDFIKIDMELIRDVDQAPYKGMIVKNLLMLAENLGIETIAEGVETAKEWQWLVENKATYIQGYLFAKPAAVPPMANVPI